LALIKNPFKTGTLIKYLSIIEYIFFDPNSLNNRIKEKIRIVINQIAGPEINSDNPMSNLVNKGRS
jgi:hypothetical protein